MCSTCISDQLRITIPARDSSSAWPIAGQTCLPVHAENLNQFGVAQGHGPPTARNPSDILLQGFVVG